MNVLLSCFRKGRLWLALIVLAALQSCDLITGKDRPPNIILIMADDMGYECLSCYGSTSYDTPVLDRLASKGIRFDHCISQPLCTPSRVKIMTGLYNYRNYDYFGHLNDSAYTFGHLMKEAGYATCIVGKWQLNGLAYKEEIPYWDDVSRPVHFGFDEYCLWQLTRTRAEGERFADPLIERNGEVLETTIDDYGPDIFTEYLLDFIERKADDPFFIYYPMVLVHEPFVPTPDSRDWSDPQSRYKRDTAYFRDMVTYTDKIVGRIVEKLKNLNKLDKTIIIFTGDNGTHPAIYTHTVNGVVQGGKGNTIDAGVHVPLILHWPEQIREGRVYNEIIEFSDFFPTLADIAGRKVQHDGRSFYPLLTGAPYEPRETAFVHYDPRWGENVNRYRNQFVQTVDYKLYQDGSFFHLTEDPLEQDTLPVNALKADAQSAYTLLSAEMNRHPKWKE